MEIKYTKQALKTLQGYDKPARERIKKGVAGLTETPPKGDIKPLQGLPNEFRLRIGKYRVIYEYLDENKVRVLMINRIDSRGDVYK